MNQENAYENSYLREQVTKFIAVQKQGKLLFALHDTEYGLPRVNNFGLESIQNFSMGKETHAYIVGTVGFLDIDYGTSQYVFTPRPGLDIPKEFEDYKVLQLGEATVDRATRTCTITTNTDVEVTFTGVEIWKEKGILFKEINRELVKANAGVVIWKMTVIEGESSTTKLFPRAVPRASNNETNLPVTGFAYVDNTYSLVYLGVAGYKTAVASMNATLWQKKGITINTPGEYGSSRTLIPDGKYERTVVPMAEYEAHHALFLSHKAVPGKWSAEDSSIFLLEFLNGNSIQSQLVTRLNESLNIPILPEWGFKIMKAGYTNNYIQDLETSGDCISGVSINVKEADWSKLIEELIVSEELAL